VRNDFGLSLESRLPALGAASEGLRILSESWSPERDTWTLETSGAPSRRYDLAVLDPSQIRSIDGAELMKDSSDPNGARSKLRIQFPTGEAGTYVRRTITFHFTQTKRGH
jgi:hypothetical protein